MDAVHDSLVAAFKIHMAGLEAVGIARDGVSILLRESPPENWGLNGGQAASDYDLGFSIDV